MPGKSNLYVNMDLPFRAKPASATRRQYLGLSDTSLSGTGLAIGPYSWRDGRVDEGGGLENRYTGDCIVGSNPTPSAIWPRLAKSKHAALAEGSQVIV